MDARAENDWVVKEGGDPSNSLDYEEVPGMPPLTGQPLPGQEVQEQRPWNDLTDSEKIDALFGMVNGIAGNVNWLCQQVYGIITAASNLPGVGGMLFRKGMPKQ